MIAAPPRTLVLITRAAAHFGGRPAPPAVVAPDAAAREVEGPDVDGPDAAAPARSWRARIATAVKRILDSPWRKGVYY